MEAQATQVLAAMTNASETVRGAIASSIPVANNQVLTVALPGTVIDWKDYYYNVSKHVRPPLDVQVKEARLVDGMIPLSKYTAGKTGKSVARSYLAALDLLVPVEASVSGVVSNENTNITDPRLKTIRERYKYSMGYLTSPDDTPSGNGRTKVETYVIKQSAWAKEVAEYQRAQAQALERLAPPAGATTAQIKASQEKYMQWIQEHAREFKNTIQTKYMDWVVHGYKFMAIEANTFLPVLSSDSTTDNQKVKAAYAHVYNDMDTKNAESRGQDTQMSAKTDWVKRAFNADPITENVLRNLIDEQKKQDEFSLNRNNRSVRDNADQNMEKAKSWIDARVKQITQDIEDLRKQLTNAEATPSPNAPPMLPVVNAEGIIITGDELVANPSLKNPGIANVIDLDNEETWRNAAEEGPDSWTKVRRHKKAVFVLISMFLTVGPDFVQSIKQEQLLRVIDISECLFYLWQGRLGMVARISRWEPHKQQRAMSSMSNLDVEVSMSCMVVEIERPWLHAELFADAELDSGSFLISPGEDALKDAFDNGKTLQGEYQQFSSYPTAFVIAADIELTFSGDTTKLESAVSASSTQANVSVGWGPFAVSGSHSSSKSKSKTKMESTATGCRISVEAPQIVGWVQTLLPMLPKSKSGLSTMSSPFSAA
ncbi:hypothetical protein CH063_10376 [Colletotrichum higginsianum]|uniref:Uncharacterized protein n=1 Tax=Colletotrichum higginsianum (strain IMI 349063) TaxID=759273 RepID=H1VH85_COLHI|nr:hypothetical protein CH63R_09602 [Colletotrichum higginsianum IMI 349063]OBR08081.1 hypothetical protein CH63R_09602 [Colletotrichum higginsianum IMI 349063]CCF39588.1 hypothetical protein CH063_10376 [Colletotrichum higginsianum]